MKGLISQEASNFFFTLKLRLSYLRRRKILLLCVFYDEKKSFDTFISKNIIDIELLITKYFISIRRHSNSR